MQKLIAWWSQLYARLVDRPFAERTVIKGRYRVEAVLGMGSYGITYLCEDSHSGQRCVLKQVRPSKLGSKKGRPVYEYEISVLQALDHPQIPKLLESFADRGQLFLAMEYKEGKTWEDLIFEEGYTISEREALQVILDLLGIVEYVHQHGLVHRDVRIPNVIIKDGTMHLIDFGLARYLGDSATYIEESLDAYLLEKQIKREVAFRSDYFGLGHFLLFLLYTSFQPADEAEELPWEEELDLTPKTRQLIRRMIQMDEPYESADALRADLLIALAHSANVHNSAPKKEI
ncbi:serine/threonine protein kinase [Tumebacillus lipolyticus]|uniref:Serine/threonine protein kinase n=1 Tax=Tumebacillus lipolyticus TaxID=1280370 RepID=A0ABW4ZWL0_9BACL